MDEQERKTSEGFVLGLDLGQAADYTALVAVERIRVEFDVAVETRYAVRHLKRWALGTPYPEIVSDVAEFVKRPPLNWPVLVVDQTGVGKPIVDLFRAAEMEATLRPVLITTGHAVTLAPDGSWHVPKKELVAALAIVLQARRIAFAKVPERDTLVHELKHFKAKITPAGNEVFAAWRERDHDDLVLALAMSIWIAEQGKASAGTGHAIGRERPPHWSMRESRAEQRGLFGMRGEQRRGRR